MEENLFSGVLIGGMPSSGSTLLSVMLDEHPDLVCGPELTVFSHPALWNSEKFADINQNLETIWFESEKIEGVIPWSNVDPSHLDFYQIEKNEMLALAKSSNNLFEFAEKFYAKKMKEVGATKWVEKTPQNVYALSAYLRANKNATAIMQIRDPRAVIDSLVRRNIVAEVAARVWLLEANIIYSLLNDPTVNNRVYLLRYEDLICDTEIVLQGICDFLAVDRSSIAKMIARDNSNREKDMQETAQVEGSSVSAWLCSPLKPISILPLNAWKESLKAEAFEALTHTELNEDVLDQFVENGNYCTVFDLMDYFGYGHSVTYNNAVSVYDTFYFDLVKINYKYLLSNQYKKFIPSIYTNKIFLKRLVNWIVYSYKQAISHAKNNRITRAIKVQLIYQKQTLAQKHHFPYNILRRIYRALRTRIQGAQKVVSTIYPQFNPSYQWFEPINNINDYDLVVTIAFLGRHKVLRAVVNEAFKANKALNIAVVLACTDEEDVKFAKQLQKQYKYIGVAQCDNNPLGNKWHIAVECARKLSPKAIMITGSDDLVSADYTINNYNHLMNDTLDVFGMVGPRVWYILGCAGGMVESDLWKTAYLNNYHRMPLGAGRMYSAKYLESIDWKIFERHLDSLLDDKGYNDVLENNLSIYSPTLDDGSIVSIKGGWSAMNSLEVILSADSIVTSQVTGKEKDELFEKLHESLMLLNE